MTILFELSKVLTGHQQDVKALCVLNSNGLASASRDTTVAIWSADGHLQAHYRGHSHFVNALAYIPPSADFSQGLLVSGSADKTIHVFDVLNPIEPLYILTGHTDNICALDVNSAGSIVSGSWDHSAIVWKDWQRCFTLTGHSQAIWDVLWMETGFILTASADKSIKLWNEAGKCVQTFLGHTDVVRKLALVPGVGFVSASNDASLRVWTLSGECLYELSGHNSFVYSVCVLPSGEIASCGEDRCVKIWQASSCVQTIAQPCTSLWSIKALPSHDLAVAGSDGIIRIFTRSPERLADALVRKTFEESVKSQAIPSSQLNQIDPSKVADESILNFPGKKEGQIQLVKSNAGIDAYQWTQSQWMKIGQVVDAVGQNQRQVFEGREYDFVFNIDIGDGMPQLKLPYNSLDNPYQAAQDFIEKHELSQNFLDEIAQFIIKNSKGVTIGASTESNAPSDPYTGSHRYIPGVKENQPLPWKPLKDFSVFKVGNWSGLKAKLLEFNGKLQSQNSLHALNASELDWIHQLLQSLEAQKQIALNENQISIIKKALEWPSDFVFPVLDLLGALVLNDVNVLQDKDFDGLMKQLTQCIDPCMSKQEQINSMLRIRILCNAFVNMKTRSILKSNQSMASFMNFF